MSGFEILGKTSGLLLGYFRLVQLGGATMLTNF